MSSPTQIWKAITFIAAMAYMGISHASGLFPYRPPPGIAIGSAPAVSSWGPNRLDVFVRGADNAIWHAWWNGTWNDWEDLGGSIISNPAAASWSANRIDLFGIDASGHVVRQFWNGSRWSAWLSEIGAPPPGVAAGSTPAVASWGSNRLDVFVRGADNAIWHAWWNGAWNFWENRGGAILANPAAVSWSRGFVGISERIDLFGIDATGHVVHQFGNGSRWSAWLSEIGTPPERVADGSSPAVASWGPNRLDVFVLSVDNAILHAWWNGAWNYWENLEDLGPILSNPAAASWGSERIDLFGLDQVVFSGGVVQQYWNGTEWVLQ